MMEEARRNRMRELSRASVARRRAPLPEAQYVEAFPRALLAWLWAALAAGAALGLLFGWLLATQRLVLPNIEELHSMTPFTFRAFWVFAGCALGLLAAGVRSLFGFRTERSGGGGAASARR